MKKLIILRALLFLPFGIFSQSFSLHAPDSAKNIARPGSSGSFAITNPLNHNGTQFGNTPITISCIMNCTADDIYFYDFGMNIPTGVTITGLELIHSRGACNSGSYMIDTLFLAHNNAPIGTPKRDTASISEIDTLGSSTDLWGSVLTPAMLNDPSFGVIIRSTGTGICTYAHWNVQLRVYYNCIAGQDTGRIPDSVSIVARPGSTGSYSITNPLAHNGSQFTNGPITVSCAINCVANHLYFQDFDFTIPTGVQITGVRVRKTSGACNSGSYMTDTLQLVYNGSVLGQIKWDSSGVFYTDTFGTSSDAWGAVLTPTIINDPTFGVFVTSTSTGICTYMQSDLRMDVYYCTPTGPTGISEYKTGSGIRIGPNPAKDELLLQWDFDHTFSYQLTDLTGKIIQTGQIQSGENILQVAHLTKGIYLLNIPGSDMSAIRFVKE